MCEKQYPFCLLGCRDVMCVVWRLELLEMPAYSLDMREVNTLCPTYSSHVGF